MGGCGIEPSGRDGETSRQDSARRRAECSLLGARCSLLAARCSVLAARSPAAHISHISVPRLRPTDPWRSEHYLRDDIYSGSYLDPSCPDASKTLSADATRYLVVDTNIVLHQIDMLEHEGVQDVIVASTVVEEVKARNVSVYQRLRKMVGNLEKRFYVFSNEHHRETYVGKGEAGDRWVAEKYQKQVS